MGYEIYIRIKKTNGADILRYELRRPNKGILSAGAYSISHAPEEIAKVIAHHRDVRLSYPENLPKSRIRELERRVQKEYLSLKT